MPLRQHTVDALGVLAGEVRGERRSGRRRSWTLLEDGWRVATVWECALRKPEQVYHHRPIFRGWLPVGPVTIEIGESEILHGGIMANDRAFRG